jgi:hypothetical protein
LFVRRFLCVLAVAGLAAACSGAEPVVEPTPTPTPTATPTPTPTPEPTPEPETVIAPLTGEAVTDLAVLDRPVLAVKIDNAGPARPQQSLELADIVFEELVEGGVTRFVALYHSTDPGTVGPVRSGREVDADLLPAFAPVLGISGAAPPVYGDLRAAGLLVFEEGQANGAFFRERGRRAPHNLFATGANLWEAGASLPRPSEPVWAFDAEAPAGGSPTESAFLRFPRATNRWTWDPQAGDGEAGAWLREQDGAPHLTRSEAQVAAQNVVIMRVVVRSGDRRDVTGAPTAEMDVIGEGEALVLRSGLAFTARWRKLGQSAQIEWLDEAGRPLPLAPGRTWVELLPTTGGLELTSPEPAGATTPQTTASPAP